MRTAPPSVTLLTQADCHFCEHAKDVLERVGAEVPIEVEEIDLTSTEGRALATQHGVLFAPGILLNGEAFGYGRLSERRLLKSLRRLASD
ncbi:hypothetical protein GCM10011584_03740 [Nocardioides phosphati]|uniref:Thioredoxin family protein n=1 Tax=Nocardioides phosphati TaxID=1867775 RepID=A0ABQ2N7U6_9ACTN|nr:glutaredoxin family protein [Nocardioides phosphati]GGO84952.1 hypothetical protein GCM10011584_03740 [Nocardioides phosphati]